MSKNKEITMTFYVVIAFATIIAGVAVASLLIKYSHKPNDQIIREAEYDYLKESMKVDSALANYMRDRGAKYSNVEEMLNDLKVHPLQEENADLYNDLSENDKLNLELVMYHTHITKAKFVELLKTKVWEKQIKHLLH